MLPGDGQGDGAYLDRQPYFQQMPRFLIHETAIHFIDTFRYLFGEPESVFADLRKLNPVISGEDAGYLMFNYADGKRALFDGNRHLDHAATHTRCTMGEALIEGSAGTLELKGDGSVLVRKFGDLQHEALLPANQSDQFGGDCVYHLQQHVVNHVLEDQPLEKTAEEYLTNLYLEELFYQSANEGRVLNISQQTPTKYA
ncbi:MAG: putative dehydrogenase [Parasphingorhabdus sp.]|jgi:predicted dehydrogenase